MDETFPSFSISPYFEKGNARSSVGRLGRLTLGPLNAANVDEPFVLHKIFNVEVR
jgi:hypothetical protein